MIKNKIATIKTDFRIKGDQKHVLIVRCLFYKLFKYFGYINIILLKYLRNHDGVIKNEKR